MLSRITSKKSEGLSQQALDYLRVRLENRNYSITHKDFPIRYTDMACVNSSEIQVPTPKSTSIEEIQKCYAMQIHESAHIKFSSLDFDKMTLAILKEGFDNSLAQDLINIMEDYRVNMLISTTHAGAGRLMHRIHQNMVKDRKYVTAHKSLLPVLCGYKIDMNLSKKEQKKLKQAVELVKPLKYSKDLDATIELLPKLYKIFYGDMSKETKEELSIGDFKGGLYPESSESVSSSSSPKGVTQKNLEKAVEKLEKTETKEVEGGETATGGNPTASDDSEDSEEIEKEMKELEAQLAKIESESSEKLKKEYGKLIESETMKTSVPLKHFKETESSISEYKHFVMKNRSNITKLISEMKKLVLNSRRYSNGRRNGKINNRCVYRVLTDSDPRVFRKKTDKAVGDTAVLLLIDCSGSMSRDSKFIYARECAIVLHEVLRNLKVKHMIVGYTADTSFAGCDTLHTVYKTWNDNKVAHNLSMIKPRFNNRDGESIRTAINYFKDVSDSNKLCIVVSDGQPSANGYAFRDGALEDTVSAQKQMVKSGIKLINIGIGKGWNLPEKYINKVKVDEVSQLSQVLLRLLRRELRR